MRPLLKLCVTTKFCVTLLCLPSYSEAKNLRDTTVWSSSLSEDSCYLHGVNGGVGLGILLEPKSNPSEWKMNFISLDRPSYFKDIMNKQIYWPNQNYFDLDPDEEYIIAGFYDYPTAPSKMRLRISHAGGGDGGLQSSMSRSAILRFLHNFIKYENVIIQKQYSTSSEVKLTTLGMWGAHVPSEHISGFIECIK